jgi:hypothetical protein
MHGAAAAWAIGVFGLDRHLNARQMLGQRTTIGAALLGPHLGGGRIRLVVGSRSSSTCATYMAAFHAAISVEVPIASAISEGNVCISWRNSERLSA